MKHILNASTPSKEYNYELFFVDGLSKKLKQYESVETFKNLCEKGCPNYNKKWSCPPFSPSFSRFTQKYKYIKVVLLTIRIDQFDNIKNNYLKIKAANSILKSRVDKVLRSFISDDIYYISTGSCRLCKPCKCKINLPCAHPELKTYSFEALGINVSDLTADLFGIKLQWYSKNNLPEYTSVVAALISTHELESVDIVGELRKLN